jgi:membrane protein YqaA with SNARE-associated domain
MGYLKVVRVIPVAPVTMALGMVNMGFLLFVVFDVICKTTNVEDKLRR